MGASKYFTKEQQHVIIAAIEDAEKSSSGEIRVHIEEHCKADPLDRAAYFFAKLDMHKTQLRNGVLFYVAYKDHKLAVIGDSGINSCVPPTFWEEIKNTMITQFSHGKIVEGISDGVRMAGTQLKEFFPLQSNDINELSNEISF